MEFKPPAMLPGLNDTDVNKGEWNDEPIGCKSLSFQPVFP
jgi:hypothetical protein